MSTPTWTSREEERLGVVERTMLRHEAAFQAMHIDELAPRELAVFPQAMRTQFDAEQAAKRRDRRTAALIGFAAVLGAFAGNAASGPLSQLVHLGGH